MRPVVSATEFFEAFVKILGASPKATRTWNHPGWKDKSWTRIATEAVVNALSEISGDRKIELEIAAKGHPDSHGQKEYFTLDAVAYIDDWSHPLIAVEHENTQKKVRDCCWKLLCVHSDLRALICYINSTRKWRNYPKSIGALKAGLQAVIESHPGKEVALIVGEWEADPSGKAGWKEVFTLDKLSYSS